MQRPTTIRSAIFIAQWDEYHEFIATSSLIKWLNYRAQEGLHRLRGVRSARHRRSLERTGDSRELRAFLRDCADRFYPFWFHQGMHFGCVQYGLGRGKTSVCQTSGGRAFASAVKPCGLGATRKNVGPDLAINSLA